ncbi:MAG: TolC family protein [Candidatus Caldatribacteriota bacterium]
MKSLILFLFFTSSIFAATPQELANLTLERTPLIKANLEELDALSKEVRQSTLWKNPSLAIQTGRARTGSDFGYAMDMTLMQSIPWPGALEVLKRQSEITRDLRELSTKKAELRLYHLALLMSLELSSLEKIDKINDMRRNRLNAIKKYINAKVVVSDNDKIEARMIHNQILLADNFTFDLQTRIKSLKRKLQRLTGLENISVELYEGKLPKVKREDFLKELDSSPAWKIQKKKVELAKEEIKKVQYESRPEFEFGLNYRIEHLRPENEFVHANIGVTLPLWDRGQHRQQVANARLRREEALSKIQEINLHDRFDDTFQKVEVNYFQSKSFEISEVDKLEAQIRQAEEAFRRGRITAVTLLQYDNQIQNSVNVSVLSRYEFYSYLAEIYEMLGKKMEL